MTCVPARRVCTEQDHPCLRRHTVRPCPMRSHRADLTSSQICLFHSVTWQEEWFSKRSSDHEGLFTWSVLLVIAVNRPSHLQQQRLVLLGFQKGTCPLVYPSPFHPRPITLFPRSQHPPCQSWSGTPGWEEHMGSEHRLAKSLGWWITNEIRSYGQWFASSSRPISSPNACPIYRHNFISVSEAYQPILYTTNRTPS